MTNEMEGFPVLRVTEEGTSNIEGMTATEFPLTITLDNQELVTLLCSPSNLEYLAVGFLASEGLLEGKEKIEKIAINERTGVARLEIKADKGSAAENSFKRIITSGCGKGASFYSAADAQLTRIESQVSISAKQIFALVREFRHRSQIYRITGGVHSAALCNAIGIRVFNEDIGRHNAVDKMFGECMLRDIPTNEGIVITSGRISSEILLKGAKRNIPIIVSASAPTDLAVRLADSLGITLIGFVRGGRMNIYAHGWRVASDGN